MIFNKPLNELKSDDIKIFCEKQIKEGFNLDYKKDFPTDLAKTISAFANTFGGVIVIGIEEDGDGKPKLPVIGIPFENGLDLKVTNIILDNINPPLFPEIGVVEFTKGQDKRAVVIIRIAQSDETPHTINNKKSVYIRTENRNKQEEIATMEEIGWLFNRRKKSEELKGLLYEKATEKLKNIYEGIKEVKNGNGQITIYPDGLKFPRAQGLFSAIPQFPNRPLIGVSNLKNLILNDLRLPDYFTSEFFPFMSSPKIAHQSVVDYAFEHRDKELFFYEFNIYGLFFYQESLLDDFLRDSEEEKRNDMVWFYRLLSRIERFLEVTNKFYDKIGFWGLVEIKFSLEDILGLKISTPEGYVFRLTSGNSLLDSIEICRVLTRQELLENKKSIVKDIFKEICLNFNFEIGDNIIDAYFEKNNI